MSPVRRSVQELAELLDSGAVAGESTAEFAPLVALASSVREHVALPTPSPGFRAALRSELMVAAPPLAIPTAVGAGPRLREVVEQYAPRLVQSGRAITATAVGAATVATGGLIAASQHALPGELLYGLKGTTEDIRMGFSSGQAERGRLHLGFAEQRLQELELGAMSLSSDLLADTLRRLDDEALAAADDLLAAFTETADVALVHELTGFTGQATGRLGVLSRLLPPEVTALAENSIELMRRIDVQAAIAQGLGVTDTCSECGGTPARTVIDDHIYIPRPGEAPAVSRDRCDCPAVSPAPPATTPTPAPSPEPPAPEPPPAEPAELDVVPRLPEELDPLGEQIDQQVNDLLDQLPIDPLDELPESVVDPVLELQETVNGLVGEVSQTIDDLLPRR